jgi:hypothetical protein
MFQWNVMKVEVQMIALWSGKIEMGWIEIHGIDGVVH